MPGWQAVVRTVALHRRKCETRRAADGELTVGDVVIHVALTRMRLAPDVFMRSDILALGKIGRARRSVSCSDRSLPPESDAMCRCECGRCDWLAVDGISAGKGIHPGARTQSALAAVQTRAVRIGAARAEVRAADAVTAKAADVLCQCGEGMFEPGLANLFEAFVVVGSAAHSIEILRNDRMVGIWHWNQSRSTTP